VTERGWAVLKGQETIQLRSDVLRPPRERRRRRADIRAEAAVAQDDPLLQALKRLRTWLAKHEGVPAYVIFSDRSLNDMAASRPRTLQDMRGVHGVGQAKLDRYGEAFLQVVNEYGD
jgi:ATP-dependent DNA helicase RecQ